MSDTKEATDFIIDSEVRECVEQIYMHCSPDDDFWEMVPLLVKLCCQKVLNRYMTAGLEKLRADVRKLSGEG